MAARPNEQPIKGRVRPFRESPAGIPPGEEENLGEAACTWPRQRQGEDSFRGRGTSSFISFLRIREKEERFARSRGLNFPRGIFLNFPLPRNFIARTRFFKRGRFVVIPCTRAAKLSKRQNLLLISHSRESLFRLERSIVHARISHPLEGVCRTD